MTPIFGITASQITGHLITSSFESIATASGNGSSGTITFSGIAGTYKHLQIRAIYRDTYAGASLNNLSYDITFNSDTAANYSDHFLKGNGTSALASGATNRTRIRIESAGADSASSNTLILGASIVDIIDYANTSKYKTVRSFEGVDVTPVNANGAVVLNSGSWRSTSAITSITLTGVTAFSTNTTFALYGIKG